MISRQLLVLRVPRAHRRSGALPHCSKLFVYIPPHFLPAVFTSGKGLTTFWNMYYAYIMHRLCDAVGFKGAFGPTCSQTHHSMQPDASPFSATPLARTLPLFFCPAVPSRTPTGRAATIIWQGTWSSKKRRNRHPEVGSMLSDRPIMLPTPAHDGSSETYAHLATFLTFLKNHPQKSCEMRVCLETTG